MRIDDVLGFDFLEKPDKETLEYALKQLYLLDAIDKDGTLRTLGSVLSTFPLEPTFTKSLLAACYVSKQCVSDMIKLLSVLSTENIWLGISRQDEQR